MIKFNKITYILQNTAMKFIEIEKDVKKKEWSMIDLHSHPHYEIYFLQKGSRTFFLSNALYKLTAPVMIIIPPHVLHKTEGGVFERCNINVSDSYLDDFQKHVLSENALSVIKLDSKQSSALTSVFNKLISVDKRKKFSENILNTLFSYAIFLISDLQKTTFEPNAAEAQPVPPLILKIIDYLNTNFADKITLTNISKNFFISKGTLIYNFNKFLGCSPIDYLLNIRITKAKELLINTKKSVNEISELCGFSSANYFGLIFKHKENLSPLTYRKYQRAKL